MFINSYFPTVIWSEEKPEFVKSLNKASNKYISDARKREKEFIKKYGDFGRSYHSTPLTADNDFLDFRNYIGQKSWEYLDHQGYDMSQYTTMFSEMWVQEFAKKGGDRIRPGTKKGNAYCARSAKIKKCKNPPCANALSRKKWKCQGSRSVA